MVVSEVKEKLSPEPFRLFVLLQRESRFVDLVLEDVGSYSDAMVGAAVRPVLEKVRKALLEYVVLEPILDVKEGDGVSVKDGFDADSIQLIGDISGGAPFSGVVCHPGWRIVGHKIPKAVPGAGGLVLERAIVEVN